MRPSFRVLALVVSLMSLACGGSASETELQDPTGWMVVTASLSDAADAEAELERQRGLGLPALSEVVAPGAVPGLPEGRFVVAAAVAATPEDADQIARGYSEVVSGVEVVPVVAPPQLIDCGEALPDPRCRVGEEGWRLLVAFHATPDESSEDWSDFSRRVLSFARTSGVSAERLEPGNTTVPIRHRGEVVGQFDLSPYIDEGQGYIVARQGAEPTFIQHGMVTGVLGAAETYLELNILEPIEME